MTQIHNIRKKYFEEGKSISEIARETGHDRKTIRTYINKQDWNIDIPAPVKENTFPKLEPFKAIIDEWLEEDKKARRKQRHTAKRVFDRLTDPHEGIKGFNCSYRTVAGYVAQRKTEIFRREEPAYIPLEHIPGEAQVDFGDSDFYLNSQHFSGKHLNMAFPHSNQGYAQLFKGENQQCLFEGLVSIFNHLGGVPTRIWFDNTSTIVTKILKDGDRQLTDDFLRFKEHYGFKAAFCNTNAGHEKGSVEGKVGYHRRNLLVPVPKISDLDTFNQELLHRCNLDACRDHYRKDAAIHELYEEDQKALLSLPNTYIDTAKYMTVRTNGYGRFYLNNGLHEYSVSPKYAKSRVIVRVSAHEVSPLDDSHRVIVSHPRLYGDFKQQSMHWLPYLTQLSRCPGALKYTGVYDMLPVTLKQFLDSCAKSDKGLVLKTLASLTENNGFESAVKTIETALMYDVYDTDSLVNIHRCLNGTIKELPPLSLGDKLPNLKPLNPDLQAYDVGLKGKDGVS